MEYLEGSSPCTNRGAWISPDEASIPSKVQVSVAARSRCAKAWTDSFPRCLSVAKLCAALSRSSLLLPVGLAVIRNTKFLDSCRGQVTSMQGFARWRAAVEAAVATVVFSAARMVPRSAV